MELALCMVPAGRRAVPDVGDDAAVGEGHQDLGGLIVGGGMAEIAAARHLATFQRQVRKGISPGSMSTPRSRAMEDWWLSRWRQAISSPRQGENSGWPWVTLTCQSAPGRPSPQFEVLSTTKAVGAANACKHNTKTIRARTNFFK